MKNVCIRSFSGPYFSAFGLNKEIYPENFHIQSYYGKIENRQTPNTDTWMQLSFTVDFSFRLYFFCFVIVDVRFFHSFLWHKILQVIFIMQSNLFLPMLLVLVYGLPFLKFGVYNPANICLFKINNRNTRKKYEICSKLAMKTTEDVIHC